MIHFYLFLIQYLRFLLFHRLSWWNKVKNSFPRRTNRYLEQSPKVWLYNKIEPVATDETLKRWTDSRVRAHVYRHNTPTLRAHLSTQNVIAKIKEIVSNDAGDSTLIEPRICRGDSEKRRSEGVTRQEAILSYWLD